MKIKKRTKSEQNRAKTGSVEKPGNVRKDLIMSSQNTDSTNESVSAIAIASVSAASPTVPVFAFPNVDTLSDAVIYSLLSSQSTVGQ
nr:hypothetical protein [Tanacetum cinerariifolium]